MKMVVKKWLIKPLLITTASVVALLSIGAILLSTEQQRIVDLAVGELNKQVKGELTIAESQISFFKNFPYMSIALHDGRFYGDKTENGKPICQFDRVYVGFSLIDLLQKDYDITRLTIQGGYLDLIQAEDGTLNLLEAERSTDSSQVTQTDTALVVKLEEIVLTEMHISFFDKASGRKFRTQIEKLSSTFDMDSNRLSFSLTSNMKLDVTSEHDTTLFRDKNFRLQIAADYKLHTKLFEISSCNFKLQDAGFNVTGYANLSDTTHLNFRIKGAEQDFNLFTAFLPNDVKKDLKPFQYDGRLHFDALVRGQLYDERLPLIEVAFGCEDAWFLNTGSNKKVDQLGFNGFYTNGRAHSLETSELHILSVSARPEKGVFKGNFVVRDFNHPQALVQISSELELKFLGEFLGIPDLKQITGKIKLEMDFKELHDIRLPEQSLNKLKEGIQSKLLVEDLTFRIPGYPHAVRNMNLQAEMKDGQVTIDSASLKIGESDVTFSGSLSDVRAFLRERDKPINLALHVNSKELKLSNLLSYDTNLVHKWNEDVHHFNISLMLETTVRQLLNPSPLPKGTFEMKNLRGSFKNYAHTFKDLGAKVQINDTLLRFDQVTGMIDSSDVNFKGQVVNYHLWFDDIKKGKTQIAIDFKSNRFAFKDVFTREVRKYFPKGYRREELSKVSLQAKIDLRYDTNFRFVKAHVMNVTADIKNQNLKLREISGGVKYGSKILSFDTLKGKVGNSDFDINLKYYFKGIDKNNNKIANSLKFTSKLLDVDEMSQYDLAPKQRMKKDSTGQLVAVKPDTSQHAKAFNIFMIPFSDFNAQLDITKIKYNKLWLKDINARLAMRQDQTISIDTLTMKVAAGGVAMSGKLNGSNPNEIYFTSNININQVDLEKMLLKLDHFGEDVLVNKNLKGKLSGTIKSYVQVHPDLVPIMANTKAEMTLNIYNGSLVDFAPMQAMANYFKDKNLNLIRFDTLQNNLTFSKGILTIPNMDINSSLGYIQMSGKQSLDLSMEYYVRVPMKMVTKVGFSALFNRKPEEVDLHQVDEIEYLDKDKKIAFMNLKVTGTPEGTYEVALGKRKGKKSF